MTSIVDVHHLEVSVEGTKVLRNVSLAIERGTCTALLGANGSGKTTLVRALLGLQPADDGQIIWFNEPGVRYQTHNRVALVPQLLPGVVSVPISVHEFVASSMSTPSHRWLWRYTARKTRAARVRAALQDVDLEAKEYRRIDALSGGEQRRALLARAIASGADVFFFDEPLAGVDLLHQERLVVAMQQLISSGATVVIVAHELEAIAGLVTRAVVLGGTGECSVLYDGGPEGIPGLRNHEDHHLHEHTGDAGRLLDI